MGEPISAASASSITPFSAYSRPAFRINSSLGFVTDPAFIERYCDETEFFIFPIALEVDYTMYHELINLVITRRKYLEDSGYILKKKESSPK